MDGDGEDIGRWLKALPGAGALPFSATPPALYRVADLYAGYDPQDPASFADVWDARVYEWTRAESRHPRRFTLAETLAMRLHDAAIDRLVADYLAPKEHRAIGFMGGHAIPRDAPVYAEVARIARTLRRQGFRIVTGGGPGMMEAANFGAFLAPYDQAAFDAALAVLHAAPSPDVSPAGKAAWTMAAANVRAQLLGAWDADGPAEGSSLGIPTWYYGQEPPNLFATASGKYFLNSLREDGLVSVANGGLFFAPGDAGTVQEVFQNANYNYYRGPETRATPMVFFGRAYWGPDGPDAIADHSKPVFPLVRDLAAESQHPFSEALLLSDDPAAIAAFFAAANAEKTARPRCADLRLCPIEP